MHLINSFALGGAETVAVDLAVRMDKETFEVFVCSIGRRNDDIERAIRGELLSKDIVTLSLDKPPRRGRVRAIWKLYRFLSENRIDIVHTHCPSPDFYGKVAAFLARTPVVLSTIQNVQGYSPFAERILKHLTSKYVALSETVRRYAISDLLIPPEKVEVIYNAVDLKRFGRTATDRGAKLLELGISGASEIVSLTGRITEQKGHVYAIEAAEDVLREFPATHFLMVGDQDADPELSGQLKELVRAKALQDKVTFTGVRQDFPEILAVTDIFIQPSLWEGLSIALLAAMATGIPVVVTDVGSNAEFIDDGENGLVIPAGDAQMLARRIKELLADRERARRLGMRAKATVRQRFSIQHTIRAYEHLYLGFAQEMDHYSEVTL